VVFKLALGLDGILAVEVVEKATGMTKRVRIDGATARLSPAQLVAARERTLALWSEREGASSEAEPVVASPEPDDVPSWEHELRRLVARANDLLHKMSQEDRADLEGFAADAYDAIARRDEHAATNVRRELEDIVHYVEEA
jgi:molecular chaperone DnaK (HSP70)